MGKHERRVSEAREGRQAEGVTPVPPVVTPRALAKLVVLGAMSALWSLVLWQELVLVRAGGSSFCGFGGKFDCSAVWDGAFASAVHRLTGLPIAGWGLVWSVVAFLLPLAALLRRAEGKSIDPLVSGVRLTAVAGVLTVAVMLAASAVAGAVCVGCIATYVLVGAYAFIALLIWRPAGFPAAGRGATAAAAVAAAAFLLLLYPGLRTPKTRGEAGRNALEGVARSVGSGAVTPSPRDSQRDLRLTELIESLEPPLKQTLADSLAIYRASPTKEPPLPPGVNSEPPPAPPKSALGAGAPGAPPLSTGRLETNPPALAAGRASVLLGVTTGRTIPHSSQNFAPSRTLCPQFGQVINYLKGQKWFKRVWLGTLGACDSLRSGPPHISRTSSSCSARCTSISTSQRCGPCQPSNTSTSWASVSIFTKSGSP